MSKYIRVTKGLNDKGVLIKPSEINKHIKNPEIDHYISTYYYNEDHFKKFQQTHSVAGFENLTTDKIWWDLDSKDKLSKAKNEAITLIERLQAYNVKPYQLEIYFSGDKGFHIILNLERQINKKQVLNIAQKFAKDLESFDTTVYNENRYLRAAGTKHQKSGLYKTQITYEELQSLSSKEDLINKAQNPPDLKKTSPKSEVTLPDELFDIKETKIESETKRTDSFDLTTKPRSWKASKWALLQGFFKQGEKHTSLMILTATLKALGHDKKDAYYLCKSALEKSYERYGNASFNKETEWDQLKSDLYNNIISKVYSDIWKGGQYSEKEDTFLQTKAEELGIKELTTSESVDIKGALRLYKDYAKNINKLTLKTGIKEIDDRQRITVGMSFGIIAAPGVGKTSIALQMLHSMSKSGEFCIFFSYDMYAPLIVQKIIQKHWNNDSQINEVFKKYEEGDEEFVAKIEKLITEEYPNVEFCFETAQSIDDIYRTIRDAEQKHGKKCKFIVIDYNELVITDVSDPTQSSNYVAQKVRELASKESLCVLSLFQPNKMAGDPSNEINSYRSAKGGSGIEQSVSLMFGVSRPGFNPRKPEEDRYMSINCVKNRMGPIFSVDLFWNGYKGEIRTLDSKERSELAALRKAKEEEKNGIREDW